MDEPAAPPALPEFEALTLPLIGRLRRYALRLTGDPSSADDLVQAAYLNALRGWHTFKPGSDPARWMYTILRNAWYRTHRLARETVPLDEPELESLAGTMDAAGELDRGAPSWQRHPDLGAALDRAIGALPDWLRLPVLLVDVEGYAYEEAARELGVPIGTVRSRLYRARRQLQQALRAHAEDAGLVPGGER